MKHSFPFGLNRYITSNQITAKLDNVCVHGPKQVAFARAHSIDPLSWSEVQEGESQAENFRLPMGTGRNSSSQHQREGGLSCSVWWAERLEAAWSSGVFLPPINKPPKNKQFHPTEKEMGQWDKRGRADRCQKRVTSVTEGTRREAGGDERMSWRQECFHERSIRLVVSSLSGLLVLVWILS